MAHHDGSDEYDQFVDDLENIDWSAVEGMQAPGSSRNQQQSTRLQSLSRSSSDFFNGSDAYNEAFMDEVTRIETQAMAIPGTGRLQVETREEEISEESDFPERRTELSPALNTPSRSSRDRQSTSRYEYQAPPTPLKRRISSSHLSSPRKRRRKLDAKEKMNQLVQTFESALECPICFDIIAAAHILSCGHTGCALCLCNWTTTYNHRTCPICRARISSTPLPNYMVDEMAVQFFDTLAELDDDGGEYSLPDRKSWERRVTEGKAEYRKSMARQTFKPSSRFSNNTSNFRPYQHSEHRPNHREYIVISEEELEDLVVAQPYHVVR